jgi:hypothetical protein
MVPSVSNQLFGLSLLVCCAVGQILRFGHCPYFSPLKDFEMNKVSWFYSSSALDIFVHYLVVATWHHFVHRLCSKYEKLHFLCLW